MFKVSILNQSGELQSIVILQEFVDQPQPHHSLVWKQKKNSGKDSSFSWNEDWGIGWGELTNFALNASYTGKTSVVVEPDTYRGVNAVDISWIRDSDAFALNAYNKEEIEKSIYIKTDKSFDGDISKNIGLAVYVDTSPCIVFRVIPNYGYLVNVPPVYYVAVLEYPLNTLVDISMIPNARKIDFATGVSEVSFVLNKNLVFRTPSNSTIFARREKAIDFIDDNGFFIIHIENDIYSKVIFQVSYEFQNEHKTVDSGSFALNIPRYVEIPKQAKNIMLTVFTKENDSQVIRGTRIIENPSDVYYKASAIVQ